MNDTQPVNTPPPQERREVTLDESLRTPNVNITTETTNAQELSISLLLIPLPSFLEESGDILPASPSPNATMDQSHLDLLDAFQTEAVTSTP